MNLLRLIEKLLLLLKAWFQKRPRFLLKPRLLAKPAAFVPLVLVAVFLLFAGIYALTQESGGSELRGGVGDLAAGDLNGENPDDELFDIDGDFYNEWVPPSPPRWYRSNAGGMTLEEVPSRLAALRSKYALVVDYVHPDEVEPRLEQYYQDDYLMEIHVLYENKKETRRQWLFIDEDGRVRVNAVFKPEPIEEPPDEVPVDIEEEVIDGEGEEGEEEFIAEEPGDAAGDGSEVAAADEESALSDESVLSLEGAPSEEGELSNEGASGGIEVVVVESPHSADIEIQEAPAAVLNKETLVSIGFIELYNEKSQIVQDRWLFENDNEIITTYFYNKDVLIRAETMEIVLGAPPVKVYTDNYRYNRSFALRNVERRYHEMADDQPIRLAFPYRVLEAAANEDFINEKLYLNSDFLGNFSVGEGFRMVYETDSRGRILSQKMLDDKDETVWTITNTWAGDRIVSVLKTEGENQKLTEYEYDNSGNRVVQRDMNNGLLERRVLTEGDKETEELYMNGVVVLRAYWEDGRKIREERVRRR